MSPHHPAPTFPAQRYPLVVFDWDGTLFDSAGSIVRSLQAAVAEIGGTPPSADDARYVIGLDLQRNTHEGRSGMGMSYLNKPWVRDAKFANLGLFSELRWQAAPSTLWVGGLRLDRAQAWDYRNPASTHKTKPANAQRCGFFLGLRPGTAVGLPRLPAPRRNQPDCLHRFIAQVGIV